jgi:ABC-type polysaccharide/polyol phosphate transport system ATPase subunit
VSKVGRPTAVTVDGLSKSFRIPQERVHTLKERALHPFRRPRHEELRALGDVTFTVKPGEFFGIVGRNGSGKSTLLKCLAGIYRADAGTIRIDGHVSTFIELGVGFNPDLAARDNVLLNGIMLGLSPRQALERFDRIIEFAELEEFVDLKLKNYSSGMQIRLAFSVMVQVDADVLLIDEVLAVGDASFQQKCFEQFHRLRDEGKTILFVTHDMDAVQRFCDRAMLLERGVVRLIGAPQEVGMQYLELNFGRDRLDASTEEERLGTQEAEITEAWFEDEAGVRIDHLAHGKRLTFRMRIRFNRPLDNPIVAFLLEDEQRHTLFATSNEDGGETTGSNAAGDEGLFSVALENWFAPGRVYATPWILRDGATEIVDRRPRIASLVVTALHRSGGVVALPHRMSWEPAPRGAERAASG